MLVGLRDNSCTFLKPITQETPPPPLSLTTHDLVHHLVRLRVIQVHDLASSSRGTWESDFAAGLLIALGVLPAPRRLGAAGSSSKDW